jgi:hypothetical protein
MVNNFSSSSKSLPPPPRHLFRPSAALHVPRPSGHVPTTAQEAFEIVAKAGRATPEEIFSLIANTGRHHMCVNILRELIAGDKAWLPFMAMVLLDEDDHSLMTLSLSDILAVDISKITDPNLRYCHSNIPNNVVCNVAAEVTPTPGS